MLEGKGSVVASRPDSRKGNTAGGGDETATGLSSAVSGERDPFSGRALSHYRLEGRLGSGGMGLLYRATDLVLGRPVAVKLLARHLVSDESAKVRFMREARAASALDHPNIATIYEVGEQDGEIFIVMALYEGETLKQRIERGRLPLPEALADLRQVTLGLEAAHRAGIVHRDIKPANVFLTRDGTVKLLDFGLAKLLSHSQSQLTQDGQAMGTVLYMSPEQLGGELVDARTDLWSLGVLAYEMLSGVSPFRADSNAAIATRILNDQPPSLGAIPGVPVGLAELVSKLLRKNPAERPPSATELLSQLSSPAPSRIASAVPPGGIHRATVAVAAAAILALVLGTIYLYVQRREARSQSGTGKSLVVLPFLNASGNSDMEFLSDGIAESLIDNLSQIPELRVIARNTAFGYKGKDVNLQKLGREISVDTVLTGRVQQRGDTVTVHADLVNLADGSQLWGERFSRKLTDLPALEESVAKAISDKLRPRLAADVRQRLTKRSTDSSDAYQLYLRGRYFWNKRSKTDFDKSIEYFEQAIQVDPKYALAYAGLADAYTSLAYYELVPPKDNYARAEATVVQALVLDEELAEAHATLGFLKMIQWEWLEAEKEYQRSIGLNPNYAVAHSWYGLLLDMLVRYPEALAEFDRAHQLDPASGLYGINRAMTLCQTGQYDRGIAQIQEVSALGHPNNGFVELVLGAECYLPKGMEQEAIDQLKQAVAINPADPRFLGTLGYAYGRSGQRDRASSILNDLIEQDRHADRAVAIAAVYDGLGDNEHALEWLEKAYQRRSPYLGWGRTSPSSESLRADPRFKDLLRRLRLPP